MAAGPLRSVNRPMPIRTTLDLFFPGVNATERRGARLLSS